MSSHLALEGAVEGGDNDELASVGHFLAKGDNVGEELALVNAQHLRGRAAKMRARQHGIEPGRGIGSPRVY